MLVSITWWKAGKPKHEEMRGSWPAESKATFTELSWGLISVCSTCLRYFCVFSLQTAFRLQDPFKSSHGIFFHKPLQMQQQKKWVEVVRSFKTSFVTLMYFHEDKQPKTTRYADNKECRERCICTYHAYGGFSRAKRKHARKETHLLFCSSKSKCAANRPADFFPETPCWSTAILTFYGCLAVTFHLCRKYDFMLFKFFCIIHKLFLSRIHLYWYTF